MSWWRVGSGRVLARCLGSGGGGVGRPTQAPEAGRGHEGKCQDQSLITVHCWNKGVLIFTKVKARERR